MVYNSQISFTVDTICPWTYIALKRLTLALSAFSTAHPNAPVTFTLKFFPYQLYPEASAQGEDKFDWYKRSRYGASEEKMNAYTTIMSSYGRQVGIDFKFGGIVANTLSALRVICWWQEERGNDVAKKIIESLYRQYFEEEAHPSSKETLLNACIDAGIGKEEANRVVEDDNEGLIDVKKLIQEQLSDGVDSVPNIIFEGKKRDFTLIGAKEVDEYVKTMEQILKESS